MEMTIGDVVLALAGREKGMIFFIVGLENSTLLLANGKGRKMETPKRKNIRHVQKISLSGTQVAEKIRNGDKVLNSELRSELAKIGQKFNSQNQGG